MTTVDDAIDEALGHLEQVNHPIVNRLLTAVDIDDTTIAFEFALKGVGNGALLGLGNEMCLVLDYSEVNQTANVQRGYRSTATAHSVGALIEVRPTYSRANLLRACKAEIAGWPADFFWLDEYPSFATSSGVTGYDFDLDGVLSIYDINIGAEATDSSLAPLKLYPSEWRLQRKVDSTVFASGSALVLPDFGTSRDVTVTVRKSFVVDPFDGSVDLSDDCHVPEHMHDIVALGAAARVLQEAPRTRLTVGDKSTAETVPAGMITSVRQDLKRQRDQRLAEARLRQLHEYPYTGG